MDLHDAATAAIEDWARRRRPNDSGFRWAGRTPVADWHYTDMTWNREMSEIQRAFERSIGFPIALSPSERRKTAGLTLMKTHYVLVRKAETSSPGGGPGTATEILNLYAYRKSFTELSIGYGSALAVALLIVTLLISGVLFALRRAK